MSQENTRPLAAAGNSIWRIIIKSLFSSRTLAESATWVIFTLFAQGTAAQSLQKTEDTHGLIVAATPVSWESVLQNITLRSRTTGAEYILKPAGIGLKQYSRWIPAGQYDIKEMAAPRSGPLSPITVEAGRATDLGGLRWFNLGGYKQTLLPFVHPELANAAAQEIQRHNDRLVSLEALSWRLPAPPLAQEQDGAYSDLGLIANLGLAYQRELEKTSVSKQLEGAATTEEFLELAKSGAIPVIDEPATDEAGTLYFGADFGQIRIRTPSGEWKAVDTGTTLPITAVFNDRSLLVAGTRDGQIRMQAEPSKPWVRVSKLESEEMVVDLDRTSNGQWMVLTARIKTKEVRFLAFDKLNVYTASRQDFSDLVLLKSFDVDHPMLSQKFPFRGEARDGFYYFNSGEAIERLELASGLWKSLKPNHAITHFRISGSSGLMTTFLSKGIFSKLSISEDEGATWRSVETPPYGVNDILFLSPQEARANRWNPSMFTVKLEFYQFDATKKDWSKTGEFDSNLCRQTLRDRDGNSQFCLSRAGSILKVEGTTLKPEFVVD